MVVNGLSCSTQATFRQILRQKKSAPWVLKVIRAVFLQASSKIRTRSQPHTHPTIVKPFPFGIVLVKALFLEPREREEEGKGGGRFL